MLDMGYRILYAGHYILDVGCLGIRYWILDVEDLVLYIGCWALDIRYWVLYIGYWILDVGD